MPILLILLLVSLLAYMVVIRRFAPWVPTRRRDLARIVRLLQLQKWDICYDLGSGDGTVALALAKYSHAKVIGIELFPPLYLIALLRSYFQKGNTPRFFLGDMKHHDISDATHVYVFWMGSTLNHDMVSFLRKKVRPGTLILSYIFPIESLPCIHEDRGENGTENPLRLYQV